MGFGCGAASPGPTHPHNIWMPTPQSPPPPRLPPPPSDHLVNLRLRHTPLKTSAAASYPSTAAAATLASFDAADAARSGAAPAAHSGYLRRAAAVPAEQLYALARVQGKRLVLAGGAGLGAGVFGVGWVGGRGLWNQAGQQGPRGSPLPGACIRLGKLFPTQCRPLPGRRCGHAVRAAPAGRAAHRGARCGLRCRLCRAARGQRGPGRGCCCCR